MEFGLTAKLSPEVDDSDVKGEKDKLEREFESLEVGVEVDRGELKEAREEIADGIGDDIWDQVDSSDAPDGLFDGLDPLEGVRTKKYGKVADEFGARAGKAMKGAGKFAGHVMVAKAMRKVGLPVTVPSTDLGDMFSGDDDDDEGGGGGGSSGGASGGPATSPDTGEDIPSDVIPILQSQLEVQEDILSILDEEFGGTEGGSMSKLKGGGGGLLSGLGGMGGGALAATAIIGGGLASMVTKAFENASMPDLIPDDLPNLIPDEMPQLIPDEMPDLIPDKMPQLVPDEMPDLVPDEMPQLIPDELPDLMPDELPTLGISDEVPELEIPNPDWLPPAIPKPGWLSELKIPKPDWLPNSNPSPEGTGSGGVDPTAIGGGAAAGGAAALIGKYGKKGLKKGKSLIPSGAGPAAGMAAKGAALPGIDMAAMPDETYPGGENPWEGESMTDRVRGAYGIFPGAEDFRDGESSQTPQPGDLKSTPTDSTPYPVPSDLEGIDSNADGSSVDSESFDRSDPNLDQFGTSQLDNRAADGSDGGGGGGGGNAEVNVEQTFQIAPGELSEVRRAAREEVDRGIDDLEQRLRRRLGVDR